MLVEWDDGRFSTTGRLAVEVVRLLPRELTLVPLVCEDPDPDGAHELLVPRVERIAESLNERGVKATVQRTRWTRRRIPSSASRRPGAGSNSTDNLPERRAEDPADRERHRLLEGRRGRRGEPGGLAEVGGYVSWATSLSMQHELGHNLGPRHPPDARDRRGRWCDAVTDADAC